MASSLNLMNSTNLEKAIWSLVKEREEILQRMSAKEVGLELMRQLIIALPEPGSFALNTVNSKKKSLASWKKVKDILSKNMDPKTIDISSTTDSFGRTPLHYFCRYKGFDLNPLLKPFFVERCYLLEKACSRGYTPLLMLCDEPNPPALKMLLELGADSISPRTRFTNSSPLLLACYELKRASTRNSPVSSLHAATVTMLAYHIDSVLGLSLCSEPDLRGETVLSVAKSSSAVNTALLQGLQKSSETRTKWRSKTENMFTNGFDMVYDIILSYLIPPRPQSTEQFIRSQFDRRLSLTPKHRNKLICSPSSPLSRNFRKSASLPHNHHTTHRLQKRRSSSSSSLSSLSSSSSSSSSLSSSSLSSSSSSSLSSGRRRTSSSLERNPTRGVERKKVQAVEPTSRKTHQFLIRRKSNIL